MSTQHGGGSRKPSSAVSTGSPGPAGKKATPPRQSSKGGGPRKPITPVKVGQNRNWGPIILFVAVGLLAAGIIGYGGYYVYKGSLSWEDKAAGIDGIVNLKEKDASFYAQGQHKEGKITYPVSPPAGGPHNAAWQRCLGDVYEAPIASEHALHSLEHGAVWITYRPDLPQDQIDKLVGRTAGRDYTFLSPYEGLDKPISLQVWGYQLKVDRADDKRIDAFINALRGEAGPEKGATCASGNYVTATGTTPRDMSQQQPQPGG